MKKKIGGVIVSYMNHNNYGSSLQAYATLVKVQNLGYDFEFIKYNKQRNVFDWIKIAPGLLFSGGLTLIMAKYKLRLLTIVKPQYQKDLLIRNNVNNQFKEKCFVPYFRYYDGYEDLKKGSLNYHLVMVGSDQVWRPFGFYSNYWNLMFVDDLVPKISYASSFGVSSLPTHQIKGTKRYLDRLDAIGVREAQAKEIVDSLSTNKATVVADPTMLLTKEEWTSFAGSSAFDINEPYIFCYLLGTRKDIRKEVQTLKEKTGYKVVFLCHMDEYIAADEGIGDFAPYNVDPKDFVKLISKAEYVCTDSFHGTVFSILMERKFISFYRVKPSKSGSTHSRIDSLLNIFGLDNRKFKQDVYNEISQEINYSIVAKKLRELRDESYEFLKNSLKFHTQK
ncbi:MAG: polysaccharide pyruvyl transferase family protein [Paludibacteraceae bacterium]